MNIFKNKKLLNCFVVILLIGFFVLSVNYSWAQDPLVKTIENCKNTGDCELNDFMRVIIQASEMILGIVGSLALLMFIYGGVMFLVSAGNSEKVTQARQIIIGAVIGLVIVFSSYMIIQITMDALGVERARGGLWAGSDWFN